MWILNKPKLFALLLYYGSSSPVQNLGPAYLIIHWILACATLHHLIYQYIYGYSFPSVFDLSSFLYSWYPLTSIKLVTNVRGIAFTHFVDFNQNF